MGRAYALLVQVVKGSRESLNHGSWGGSQSESSGQSRGSTSGLAGSAGLGFDWTSLAPGSSVGRPGFVSTASRNV